MPGSLLEETKEIAGFPYQTHMCEQNLRQTLEKKNVK